MPEICRSMNTQQTPEVEGDLARRVQPQGCMMHLLVRTRCTAQHISHSQFARIEPILPQYSRPPREFVRHNCIFKQSLLFCSNRILATAGLHLSRYFSEAFPIFDTGRTH